MERSDIIEAVLKSEIFPLSFRVENVDKDFGLLYKMLKVRGKADDIGMSKERDRGLIWFRLRRSV